MLKIMIAQDAQGTAIVLAGRLVGPWVEEVRRCWLEAEAECRDKWRVNLRETTHVDAAGKALLSEMFHRGGDVRGHRMSDARHRGESGRRIRPGF